MNPKPCAGRFGVATNGSLVIGVGNLPGTGVWRLQGAAWQRSTGINDTTSSGLGAQAIIQDRNGHLLASYDWGGNLYRSTNSGQSFTHLTNLVPDTAYSLLRGPDGTLYAGTEIGGVFYSTNDAAGMGFTPKG